MTGRQLSLQHTCFSIVQTTVLRYDTVTAHILEESFLLHIIMLGTLD